MRVTVGVGVYEWTAGQGLDPAAVTEMGPVIGRLVGGYLRKAAVLGGGGRSDLVQAGFVGALRAAKTFDPARGMGFASWAALRARDEMRALCTGQFCLRLDEPDSSGGHLGDALMTDPDEPSGADAAEMAMGILTRMPPAAAAALAGHYGIAGAGGKCTRGDIQWALRQARRTAARCGLMPSRPAARCGPGTPDAAGASPD
jgi:DNA-directed RNA polymerase specialized sigma24 family protein